MSEYAYYNGVFTPYGAAAIPISDRSIFFSDAVYDVMIGRAKSIYQAEEHLARLYANAERIGFENPPKKSELCEVIYELVALADLDDFMLYIQLSSDSKRRTHSRSEGGINVLVTVTECTIPNKLEQIKAITLPDMRHSYCDVKTTSLLPAVLSVEEAKRRGADIAIFHKNGYVTECSYANIAVLKDGTLITHPCDSDILPGITQRNLEDASKRLGISTKKDKFTVSELYEADAVIISSTTKLIKVCTDIDGISLTVKDNNTVALLFDEILRNF